MTSTDDTGLEETVSPRQDPVAMTTLPETYGPGLGEEEVCFKVCLLKRL